MTEKQLVQLNNEDRLEILKKLGYMLDDKGFIIDIETKEEIICKYSKQKVHINFAAILPGSALIINATQLTMAQYFVAYDDDDE